ncbi:MAG TPA: hypothetical protein VLC09_09805 [Polyangiaceae bacterium]|nr:hypothetical protein [Polyangiaceae bacterium]
MRLFVAVALLLFVGCAAAPPTEAPTAPTASPSVAGTAAPSAAPQAPAPEREGAAGYPSVPFPSAVFGFTWGTPMQDFQRLCAESGGVFLGSNAEQRAALCGIEARGAMPRHTLAVRFCASGACAVSLVFRAGSDFATMRERLTNEYGPPAEMAPASPLASNQPARDPRAPNQHCAPASPGLSWIWNAHGTQLGSAQLTTECSDELGQSTRLLFQNAEGIVQQVAD